MLIHNQRLHLTEEKVKELFKDIDTKNLTIIEDSVKFDVEKKDAEKLIEIY